MHSVFRTVFTCNFVTFYRNYEENSLNSQLNYSVSSFCCKIVGVLMRGNFLVVWMSCFSISWEIKDRISQQSIQPLEMSTLRNTCGISGRFGNILLLWYDVIHYRPPWSFQPRKSECYSDSIKIIKPYTPFQLTYILLLILTKDSFLTLLNYIPFSVVLPNSNNHPPGSHIRQKL